MTDKTTDIKMALENMIRFRDTIERLGGSMAKEFDVETKGKRTYSMN
ncbi:nickel transporter, partial [Salmonella enterica subsp. enterica serovar Typhimurium]|nr:nickel transporter [Salmonella enterica subsp. enterica serovar Typhimurium]